MDCLSCGSSLVEHMRFCPVCGTLVRQGAAAVATGDGVRRLLEQALGRSYEILRVVGRGGMGVVYLARERGLDRLVAIKVLAPALIATADHQERFRREARTAAKLTHPGILQLHAYGEVEDFPYFVMAYVRGESLAELLRQEGRLPPATVRRILAELADALDYAHRHQVVHRDIKPENVLIEDETGRAILADFGIAKARNADTDSLTIPGSILGTPQYMSPEQAAGGEVDGRSDIYSLGVLGYTMLAGRTPFQGYGPGQTIVRHATHEPPALRSVAPEVPEDLVAAIARCLAKSPDARWPDGRSLCAAIASDRIPEAGIPDELREVSSFGSWAVVWIAFWSWLIAREGANGDDALIFAAMAMLVPIGFALQAWNIERKGFRLRDVLQVAFWPPKWWGLWWPARLRRPDDVWRCLPTSVRATRVVLSAFFLLVPIAAFLQRRAAEWSGVDGAAIREWLLAAEYALLGASVAILSAAAWRWRGRGLPADDLAKLLVGPTASTSFWTRPSIASLLKPTSAPPVSVKAAPETPHDYLRAISSLAAELTGPARVVGSDAVRAARQIHTAVEALDVEIAMLARDADPADAARREQRLAALTERDEDERQLGHLLRRQLEVVGRLRARLELASANRARLLSLARELWLLLGQADRDDRGHEERDALRARVDAICVAIQLTTGEAVSSGVESPIPLPGRARRETPMTS